MTLLVASVSVGAARADGESAVDAGSSRQQSLLEHRRQQLESLRDRIVGLDEAASRAKARSSALARERDEARRQLEAAAVREAVLVEARDDARRRAEAADGAIAALEGELAGQRGRLETAVRAGAQSERALDALEDTHGTLQARLAESEDRNASLEETLERQRARLDEERGADEALAARLEAALADVDRLEAERARLVDEREETRRAAASSEARAGRLAETLASVRAERREDEAAGAPEAPSVDAPPVAAPLVDARTEPAGGVADELVLSERWTVPLENGAPRDYVGHDELARLGELPPASACETFASGVAADDAALAKLEINGFPVTAFWVRREEGHPGICRLVPRTSGAFDARLSSLAVLRSERAIVVTRRGERR